MDDRAPPASSTSGSAPRPTTRAASTPPWAFGAPLRDLTVHDLVSPDVVFQIGVAPGRIDILTSVSGLRFDEAWPDRIMVRIGTLDVPVIGRDVLIRNKRAAGRPRDLADLADLEAQEPR
jgi:hypothetical protein